MIISDKVKVIWNKTNKKRFMNLGYEFTQYDDVFYVSLNDLNKNSRYKVQCKCDYCGKIFERSFNRVNSHDKHSCNQKECKNQLRKELNLDKYGVENVNQIPEIKQKGASAFKNRYGKNSEIHDEFINKRKITNIQKHGNAGGYRYDLSSEIHSKMVNTLLNNYLNAKCKKGCKKVLASKRQVEICETLDGVLNYEFNNKFVDIALPDEKLAIEYDGGGHNFWNDFHNSNDSVRDDLLSEHWKVIHILDSRDNVFPDIKPLIELCKTFDSRIVFIDLIKHQICSDDNVVKLNENNEIKNIF